MPAYSYTAFNNSGKKEKGFLTASSEREARRAIKELNLKIKVSQNDLLFATGYSQGGHATMGFHKTVQEEYSEEFKITASAPMSGAYDLAGVQEETMFKEYSHPGYLPYLFFSFQEVYGFYDNGAIDSDNARLSHCSTVRRKVVSKR